MRSIMRTTARRSALVAGAFALAVGAAACGGSTDTETESDPAAEEEAPAEEDTAADDEAATEEDAASDEGGTAAESGPLADEDLTAAADRFYEFFEKAAAGDYEGACGLMLDPSSGEPISGDVAKGCASGLEEGLGANVEALSAVTRDDISTTDNGDGTAAIQVLGSDFGYKMVKASDGEWYIDSGM